MNHVSWDQVWRMLPELPVYLHPIVTFKMMQLSAYNIQNSFTFRYVEWLWVSCFVDFPLFLHLIEVFYAFQEKFSLRKKLLYILVGAVPVRGLPFTFDGEPTREENPRDWSYVAIQFENHDPWRYVLTWELHQNNRLHHKLSWDVNDINYRRNISPLDQALKLFSFVVMTLHHE